MLLLAENFRLAVTSFKENGFQLPSLENQRKVKIYIEAFKETPERLAIFSGLLESIELRIRERIKILKHANNLSKIDKERVLRACESNLKAFAIEMRKVKRTEKIAAEAAEHATLLYEDLYANKGFFKSEESMSETIFNH